MGKGRICLAIVKCKVIKFPTTLLTGLSSCYLVENQQKRLLRVCFFPVQFHVTELQIQCKRPVELGHERPTVHLAETKNMLNMSSAT